MASQKILALREHDARKRIAETIKNARASGVEVGELTPNHRFPDVARVEELEYFADSFTGLISDLLTTKGELEKLKAEAKASAKKTPKPEK